MSDSRWPSDASIAESGFPLAAAEFSSIIDPRRVLATALDIYDGTSGSKARRCISNWMKDMLFAHGVPDHLVARLRVALVTDYRGPHFQIGGLGALFPQGFDEDWAEGIDSLATRSYLYATSEVLPSPAFVKSLIRAFSAKQKRVGILRMLSEIARLHRFEGLSTVPSEFLSHTLFPEPMDKVKAISLKLLQGSIDDAELRELASTVASTANAGERAPRYVCVAASEWPIPKLSTEAFTLELLSKWPITRWEGGHFLMNYLNNLLRKRTSGLENAATRASLNPPQI
jgi:hypothetical protein